MPVKDRFVEEEKRVRVNGQNRFKPASYSMASVWDGTRNV